MGMIKRNHDEQENHPITDEFEKTVVWKQCWDDMGDEQSRPVCE